MSCQEREKRRGGWREGHTTAGGGRIDRQSRPPFFHPRPRGRWKSYNPVWRRATYRRRSDRPPTTVPYTRRIKEDTIDRSIDHGDTVVAAMGVVVLFVFSTKLPTSSLPSPHNPTVVTPISGLYPALYAASSVE